MQPQEPWLAAGAVLNLEWGLEGGSRGNRKAEISKREYLADEICGGVLQGGPGFSGLGG